jgi:CHAT domain-containing protein
MEPGTFRTRCIVRFVIAVVTGLVLARDAPAQPDRGPGQGLPPWKRQLTGEAATQVQKLEQQIAQLHKEGKFTEAIEPARQVAEVRMRLQGADHWQAADARRAVDDLRTIAALPEEGRKAMASVEQVRRQAIAASEAARYDEADRLSRRVLETCERWLGEDHPSSIGSYKDLGVNLNRQRKPVEAEPLLRKALAISLKALGKDHPSTAYAYRDLAYHMGEEGKYAEAEAFYREALTVFLKSLGQDHDETAVTYSSMGLILAFEWKHVEAEAMLRRALAIFLKTLGQGHTHTAIGFHMLARALNDEGKHVEAEAMHRRALAIFLKALGESHSLTAESYEYVAITLHDQGKYGEAEAMQRRALAIYLKALGEDDPVTAGCYDSLALALDAQMKYTEAEVMHRRALAIRLKALEEGHPETAASYTNLAGSLRAQGKYPEAEAMYRPALVIFRKARREGHPFTALAYRNLAGTLDRQGKHDDALRTWAAAAGSYDQARLRGAKGLEAALAADGSPLAAFALALARAGRPRDAWTAWEQGLARGLMDEVTRRAARPLTTAEYDREALLLGQAQALDERIGKLLALKALSEEQDKLLEDLSRQASEIRRQVLELEQHFETKYRALAGQLATLEAVQKSLPVGAALIGWIDQEPYHWACLLRSSGDPIWVRLPGSGKGSVWTNEERERTQLLRAELTRGSTRGNTRPLAAALARQRLEPLKAHLQGVNRLIVVNSPGMAGVPIEVLLTSQPEPAWNGITVSYVPSASMFAYLVGMPARRDRAPTLLALADPAYPEPKDQAPAPTPPEAGLAIARVVPYGNADLNGLRAGDVLLAYAGTALKQHADLKIVAPDGGSRDVPVRYWREGIIREAAVAAGPLSVFLDSRPAREAAGAGRAAEQVLLAMRGGAHQRLPGTRREVEAVARLFPAGTVTTVMGAQACEATVQGLARSGRMKAFRYLHFAAHGQSDPVRAYRTALILAPDPDRSADPLALDSDGTITAEQIARTWELDAELVVLSACESGLGLAAGGEGYLGFAQPLFAKGARSLVLSLWNVDDKSTALLMTRFYQNLLGQRPGLSRPLPKAAALDDAKHWLRELTVDEVGAELAALERGTVRPLAKADGPAPREASSAPTKPIGVRPYAHPYYWAAFILIGDPN